MGNVKMDQIKAQSEAAYNQWAKQWRAHATAHNDPAINQNRLSDFLNIGIGRVCVAIANGFSFEENLELLKKHRKNIDIIACDKTLGSCLDHGLVPTYVMVSDANVSFETYMEKWQDKLQNTTLFINVCANPKWSQHGNWKKVYTLVHKDVDKNEIEFSELSGCKNIVIAGTNVSNMMVVLLTQSDMEKQQNYFGYDKIVLLGYDFSWRHDGKYYSFDKDAKGKRNYMAHILAKTQAGSYCSTSGNLMFSANWLSGYIKNFGLPVVLGSKQSIADIKATNDLEAQLAYKYRPADKDVVHQTVKRHNFLIEELEKEKKKLHRIGMDHHFAHVASI